MVVNTIKTLLAKKNTIKTRRKKFDATSCRKNINFSVVNTIKPGREKFNVLSCRKY